MKINPNNFERFNSVLTGIVVPRPIAFVSTISNSGKFNLSPYSFFNAVSYNPPLVAFSSAKFTLEGKRKDSLTNIEENGEFVVNVVVDEIAPLMNKTAAEYPEDINEFDISGLTPIKSEKITPPRVKESPVNMECKLDRIVDLGNNIHSSGLVIGEIVLVHIEDSIISGHRINHQKLNPTGRLAGNMYCKTNDTFELIRPKYKSS
tara:strand:- start:1011 stop:1625 length:615 start_codon:yes stop_codon:yes gene_type:complete